MLKVCNTASFHRHYYTLTFKNTQNSKARKKAKFPWNMLKMCVENVKLFQIFCKEKTETFIEMINFPQNRKDFPPNVIFPGGWKSCCVALSEPPSQKNWVILCLFFADFFTGIGFLNIKNQIFVKNLRISFKIAIQKLKTAVNCTHSKYLTPKWISIPVWYKNLYCGLKKKLTDQPIISPLEDIQQLFWALFNVLILCHSIKVNRQNCCVALFRPTVFHGKSAKSCFLIV